MHKYERGIAVDEHEISKVVVKRLPRYYRYLGDLLEAKVERISSNELSDMMNVTASQIRLDLNNIGGFGSGIEIKNKLLILESEQKTSS